MKAREYDLRVTSPVDSTVHTMSTAMISGTLDWPSSAWSIGGCDESMICRPGSHPVALVTEWTKYANRKALWNVLKKEGSKTVAIISIRE